jgi:sortase A
MIEVVAAATLALVVIGLLAAVGRSRRQASRLTRALSTPATAAPSNREGSDPLAGVVGFLRRRRWARHSLSLLSAGLLVAAAVMLGYPFYTNLYQSRVQQRLDNQLVSPELQQAYRDGRVGTGDALTRLRIPAIDVDVVVVEGTTNSALRAGAGHYPQSPLPCEAGNVAIAGHRTTYGKPFHHLDRLKEGDTLILETPVGECTYTVARQPFIVAPTDLSVVAPSTESMLTLTTCHPKGSAAQRLIVQAVMQGAASSA